jgi:hypothetical protein
MPLTAFSGTSMRQSELMNHRAEIEVALRQGRGLAQEVVGLSLAVAQERVAMQGHRPVVVPADQEAVTADLNPLRIRLFVNADDVVVEATAG